MARAGFADVMKNGWPIWVGPNGHEYAAEKRARADAVAPLIWGAGAAITCFLSLRVSRTDWFIKYRNQMFPSSRPRVTKPVKFTQKQDHYVSPIEEANKEAQAKLSKLTEGAVDVFVSLLVGVSSGLIILDPWTVNTRFQEIPLLPGRSLVAQRLCPDVQLFVQELNKKPWSKEDESIEHARMFARNCRIRHMVEDEVRQTNGIPQDEHVPVPISLIDKYVKIEEKKEEEERKLREESHDEDEVED